MLSHWFLKNGNKMATLVGETSVGWLGELMQYLWNPCSGCEGKKLYKHVYGGYCKKKLTRKQANIEN